MAYYKTVDSHGYVRIEEDCGAAITLLFHDGVAGIISIFVPEQDRRSGIGQSLLAVAEREAFLRGAYLMEADFSGSIKGMAEFFDASGFNVRENAPTYMINTGKLLSDKKTQKLLKESTKEGTFVSIEEMSMEQLGMLKGLMSNHGLLIGSSELRLFSRSLSGIVLDDAGSIQAFIFATEEKRNVHIDFLYSENKRTNMIMIALQGMLTELYAAGGAIKYPLITAFCPHDSIKRVIDGLLPEVLEKTEMSMYAVKEPEQNPGNSIPVEEALDDYMDGEWWKETAKIPMQFNIGWKAAWYRDSLREKPQYIKSQDQQPVEEEVSAEEKTESADDNIFPYELEDPLDIDYGYEKDEDEIEGLLSDHIRRITVDNLEDYMDILPPDAAQDLPRPWHRGLVMEDDAGDFSYLVYELQNINEEGSGKSQIRWFDITNQSKELLDEYSNEIRDEGVSTTLVESKASQEKKQALSEAGFALDERESDTIVITVGELMKLPFASKKTPHYVKALSAISERQFKRGICNCMINNRKGLLHDLAFLPMEWFEQDVSSVVITDDRVSGFLLVHQLASKRLSVDLLFSSSGDARHDILRMITRSIRTAIDKYPIDTPVVLRRHNNSVHALTDKLFPDKKGEMILFGERKEAQ